MVQAGIEVADALLTVREVAARMRVSVQAVHEMLKVGHLAFVNVGTRKMRQPRIPRAELERFLRERSMRMA